MHAAGLLARKFQRENGDAFAGTFADDAGISIFLKSGLLDVASALTKARTVVDADLASAVKVVFVKRSLIELKAQATSLETQLGKSEHLVGFRIGTTTNRLSILSTDVERTTAQVAEKLGTLPEDVTVELSPPIELTTDGYGGTAANNGETSGCPTFGFVVARLSDATRGLMTVGHAASTTMRYNGYASTALTSCSGGTSTTERGVYTSADPDLLGTDFAWYNSSSQVYPPLFWDGAQLATVVGARYPGGGDRGMQIRAANPTDVRQRDRIHSL